jgi:hypothetical protein
MEATFSEFSYGYALTEEIASGKLGPLVGFPIFPSLYREGRSGGGYDIQLPLLGASLFLQFKLSHYLWRSNAREWADFAGPYYRMYLRPLRHSRQHDLLVALAHKQEVYYVAPEFHRASELNDAYTSRNVFERSAFFNPLDIGSLPDDDVHYVVFSRPNSVAYLYSEEQRKIERFYFGKEFWGIQSLRNSQRKTKIDESFFEEISYQMAGIVRNRIPDFDQLETFQIEVQKKRETLREKAQFAAYLARSIFDAELFILGNENDTP